MAKFQKNRQTPDIEQEITDKIIAALEAGTPPWKRGWEKGGAFLPLRATGEPYQGINTLLLWLEADKKGYSSPYWMTYKQAKEAGGQVRKGEKATRITFFKVLEKEDMTTGEDIKIPLRKAYAVFNADQIDGLGPRWRAKPVKPAKGADADKEMDDFFRRAGVNIETPKGNTTAAYVPQKDTVIMPEKSKFYSTEEYYKTLSHEAIHWSGSSKRMNRATIAGIESGKVPSTAEYAREELVAEIGSAQFLTRMNRVPNIDNSAAYVESWLKALKNDKKYIFQAASEAQKATGFLVEHGSPESEKTVKSNIVPLKPRVHEQAKTAAEEQDKAMAKSPKRRKDFAR